MPAVYEIEVTVSGVSVPGIHLLVELSHCKNCPSLGDPAFTLLRSSNPFFCGTQVYQSPAPFTTIIFPAVSEPGTFTLPISVRSAALILTSALASV